MSRKKIFAMLFSITVTISVMILCRNIMSADSRTTNAFLRKSYAAYACAAEDIPEKTDSFI